MAGSLAGLYMMGQLLSGSITGTQLETYLAQDGWEGYFRVMMSYARPRKLLLASSTAVGIMLGAPTAFEILMEDPNLVATIAASATYTQLICQSGASIALVLNNASYYNAWRNTPANYTNLKNQINAVGSKLKDQTFSSNGTWNLPVTTLLKICVMLIGGGGAGAGASNYTGGPSNPFIGFGGGGGEIEIWTPASGLPSGNVAVSLGAGGTGITAGNGNNGAASSFGAHLTAAGGFGGQVSSSPGPGGAGGGANAGGGISSVSDTALTSAAWQMNTCAIQGGTGRETTNGANGIGSPGSNGAGGMTPYASTGGTFGAGGGQGDVFNGGGGGYNGGSGSTGGGGGGSVVGTSSSQAGGNGGNGWCRVIWVEA